MRIKFAAAALVAVSVFPLSACGSTGTPVASTDSGVKVATTAPKEVKPAAPKQTVSQSNAVKSAKSYTSFEGFSRSGLIKQLEFEGFSVSDSAYGADNCGADWSAMADKSAESYMSFESFSRSGLIHQLEFEGFTAKQAAHGATSVGL